MSKLKFDVKDIKQLSDLMKEVDVEELEITQDGDTLRLRRPSAYQSVPIGASLMPQNAGAVPHNADDSASAIPPAGPIITAPLVGTYYHAPAPDKPPFVQQGDKIKQGSTIGIIEAMKTMNPVTATQDGIIDEILTDNAQAVEFGQPLIRLKAE